MKLKELIIYISNKSKDDPHFGSIKLNKILFYSDLWAFGIFGKPITEAEYLHRPLGPAPKNLKAIQKEMVETDKTIKMEFRPSKLGTQKRPTPTREIALGIFSDEELKHIDQVIENFKDFNSDDTSKFSHDFRWLTTNEDEIIPLETVFLSGRPLTDKEIMYGQALASQRS